MTKSTSRRVFLGLPIAGASAAAYARLVEPAWLQLTRRECRIPGLLKPVNLVHLSDFHASHDVPGSLIERAIGMAVDANPDLICITGDFVTNTKGYDADWYTSVLQRLSRKAPAFAVLGNHDGGQWSAAAGGFHTMAEVTRIIERSGVQLLANRHHKLTCKGAGLQLVGVGDLWAGDLDAAKAFRGSDPQCPTIALSHNPDTKDLLATHHWNLMLSGHTHGGQVVVPIVGWSPAPVLDRRYVAGLNPWQGRSIHVSRGVGSALGLRFNCRPEVSLLRLLPGV